MLSTSLMVVSVSSADKFGIGMSRPVVAAKRICVDSGTVPDLSHGRTVKVVLGRSRAYDQLTERWQG